MVLGANPAVHFFSTGPAFARLFHDLGTDEQKQWAQVWAQQRWGATMVLTEPDAGSDVGAGRTSASQQPDGSWHISGVKRFITSGEHDMTDNIIHLVLARPEGAGPGTKGLSLFIVPKFHVDWSTGDLLERNGVYATNLEHKMGLKASTTCELTFGEREPAVGWLVGEVHDGIAQMFKVIEFARMLVGTKAIATLSTGYLNALEYTKTRVQGADLTQASDKTAPRVTVIHHPDVRRSLMTQKAYSEGLRALMLYAASVQDAVEVKETAGEDATAERALNDLLLPLVKGYGSEKSYALLAESLQCFGGSGYLQDYPIEQYIRDAKIDTLYEGTTAIQGMDLFFRKMVRDGSARSRRLGEQIGAFAAHRSSATRAGAAAARHAHWQDVQAMIGTMAGFAMASATEPASGLPRRAQHHTTALRRRGRRRRLAAAPSGRRWRSQRWTMTRRRPTPTSTAARWRPPAGSAAQVLPHLGGRARDPGGDGRRRHGAGRARLLSPQADSKRVPTPVGHSAARRKDRSVRREPP